MTSPRGFDLQRFFAAVDARRRDEQLSWPALTAAIWEKSRVLNKRRSDHPISPATIRKLAEGVSCQHALFVLRWLEVPPETFIAVPQPGTAGVPLPLADASGRSSALHAEPAHRPPHCEVCHQHAARNADYPGTAPPGGRLRLCRGMVAIYAAYFYDKSLSSTDHPPNRSGGCMNQKLFWRARSCLPVRRRS